MIHEDNLAPFSRSEGDAYKSSQAAELSLNAAILGADISRATKSFWIFLRRFTPTMSR
jgi:hypothetical protein